MAPPKVDGGSWSDRGTAYPFILITGSRCARRVLASANWLYNFSFQV
jgi:hypothetical protein